MERFIINSPIEISEINEDKPYIELTTRLCYLDYPNLNGISLSSTATESYQTLVDMPIVAKINAKGNKFGSHEVTVDKDGNTKFNTSAYGTNVEVWIKEEEVDIPDYGTKIVPCMYAKSKVWKRFENVVNLIVNKMDNPDDYGGGLFSSWELQGEESNTDKGYKEYTKFTFIANCLIDVMPAYGEISKTLDVAEKELDFETKLSEAYIQDFNIIEKSDNIKSNDTQSVTSSKEEDNEININIQGGKNMAKKKIESSSLTMNDLYQKIYEALNKKGWNSDPYYSGIMIFPEEHRINCYDIDRENDMDYMECSYSIDSNDVVTLTALTSVQMTFVSKTAETSQVIIQLDETAKLLSQKEVKINDLEKVVSEKDTKIGELETELSAKVESINKLGEEISSKDTIISEKDTLIGELTPLKEEKERLEAEKQVQEIAQKQEDLKAYATKGNFITVEELETSEELKKAIEDLDEKTVKYIRAERIEKKYEASENLEQPKVEPELETSAVKDEAKNIKTDLSSSDGSILTATEIIKRAILNK